MIVWERMTSEEATLLIAAQTATSGEVNKSALPQRFSFNEPSQDRPYPAEDLPGTTPLNSQGTWTFKDDNSALHLIRNCLGPGDGFERRHLLSMRTPYVRAFRDDITAVYATPLLYTVRLTTGWCISMNRTLPPIPLSQASEKGCLLAYSVLACLSVIND